MRLAEEAGVLMKKMERDARANSVGASSAHAQKRRPHSSSREEYSDDNRPAKRTKTPTVPEKGTGLRHFSMRVCKKVEEKGHTTHNEVADELVHEIMQEKLKNGSIEGNYDEKNIRRRVYDAINVLMAMDIQILP